MFSWIFVTDSDLSRLFEFGIWTGLGTMAPGLLVAAGASDNTFEDGERYDAVADSSQKQECISGAIPILAIAVLVGVLILLVAIATRYLRYPLAK